MEKITLSGFVRSIEPSITFEIDAKVKELQKQGVKVYNFNLGEPDFPTPRNIKLAAIEGIFRNRTKYTPVRGMPKLLEAISEKFRRDNNLIYGPEEIIVANGAKQALYLAIRTICEIGDEIIILAPYWTSYPEIIKLAGGKPVVVKSNNFRLSSKDIEKAISEKTKAIIINSPNNPTGIVYNRRELEKLGELVLKHKIPVISDEIYEKFLYDGAEHFSFAAVNPELKDYTLTINGVSKTYAMTGWRIGYCAGPNYIIKKMADLQSHLSSNACSVSQVASIEALAGNQESIQKMVEKLDIRRELACEELKNSGIKFISPKGAYYVFFKVKPEWVLRNIFQGGDSMRFCEIMLKHFQVALNPGETFGAPSWVRLSYTTGLDDLEEGLNRIKAAIEKLRRGNEYV